MKYLSALGRLALFVVPFVIHVFFAKAPREEFLKDLKPYSWVFLPMAVVTMAVMVGMLMREFPIMPQSGKWKRPSLFSNFLNLTQIPSVLHAGAFAILGFGTGNLLRSLLVTELRPHWWWGFSWIVAGCCWLVALKLAVYLQPQRYD
jgi:hypothetical protein